MILVSKEKCKPTLIVFRKKKGKIKYSKSMGFPCSSVGKESACNAGNPGLIPGSGRSPGKGNGNPLQYSCLENSVDG